MLELWHHQLTVGDAVTWWAVGAVGKFLFTLAAEWLQNSS